MINVLEFLACLSGILAGVGLQRRHLLPSHPKWSLFYAQTLWKILSSSLHIYWDLDRVDDILRNYQASLTRPWGKTGEIP